MSQNNQIATIDSRVLAEGTMFTPSQIDLIKTQIAPGATDDELKLFIHVAHSRNLDPFRKEIYAIKRWNSQERRETVAFQVSIDGFRKIAESTGKYAGQVGPFWCGADGKWVDVWLDESPPMAAKVGMLRAGFSEPVWAVVRYNSFVQKTKDGTPTRFWKEMPDHMLAKVAESQAMRKAFPEAMADIEKELDRANKIAGTQMIDSDTGEFIPPNRVWALQRVHSVGEEHGITHDDLHRWAVGACKVESLADVESTVVARLADKLADDQTGPPFAKQFLAKYGVPSDAAPVQDEPIEAEYTEVESAPTNGSFLSPEEDAVLQEAADRDLAAAKARR
jgi:phage recombination protein Bet